MSSGRRGTKALLQRSQYRARPTPAWLAPGVMLPGEHQPASRNNVQPDAKIPSGREKSLLLVQLFLMQGLKRFAGVGMQQTSHEDSCRQICRLLKTDASVRVDRRVYMRKRALRKYLADSGGGEARRPAEHAKAWQSAGGGKSGGNRAARVPPQGGKKYAFRSRNARP